MHDDSNEAGFGRREFLVSGAATIAIACAGAPVQREAGGQELTGDPMDIVLVVNGERRQLSIDPRSTLLDVLRERLGLTGTKKGCDMGQCGACTVLADGMRIDSCLALAAQYDGRSITTIEGLAKNGELH